MNWFSLIKRVILQVCAEKFHCAPEERPGIRMNTIWELAAIAEEESKRLENNGY